MAYKEMKLEKGEAEGLYALLGSDNERVTKSGGKRKAAKKAPAKNTVRKKPAKK